MDVDFLGRVQLVAVLDGVDEGFLERQPDGKNILVLELMVLQLRLDVILDALHLGGITGDGQVEGSFLVPGTHDGILNPREWKSGTIAGHTSRFLVPATAYAGEPRIVAPRRWRSEQGDGFFCSEANVTGGIVSNPLGIRKPEGRSAPLFEY